MYAQMKIHRDMHSRTVYFAAFKLNIKKTYVNKDIEIEKRNWRNVKRSG